MAAGFLSLVCAAAVLCCSVAQDSYNALPDSYKKGVDLALEHLKLKDGVQHHLLFLRSVDKSESQGGFGGRILYHHFYLKPTRCARGTAAQSPQRCPFRNDRPLMDCTVCYKMVSNQIESSPEPFVDCIHKPRLTEKMATSRLDRCRRMFYISTGIFTMKMK